MDRVQLQQFLHCMIGFKTIGFTGSLEVKDHICPEMRSFLIGKMGSLVPVDVRRAASNAASGLALAAVLREAADALTDLHTR